MKNLLILIMAVCLLSGCQKPSDKVAIESPVDSLIENWENAWNKNDLSTIENMFEPDAVYISDNEVLRNYDEISRHIRSSEITLNNLKAEKIKEWITSDIAGSIGLWQSDFMLNDSLIFSGKGAYTLIWRKNKNDEWKVSAFYGNTFTE